ncbi:hypothetical protein EVAR_75331_1 [Eumeta japonica]|uniref:Uncharacterized protein n=1 Tax=Eumeta variegata TaxID=151549 RepID=A0A4C1Y2D8_EUMVA|nr:hypothetical protein EVAR_75331_1 [Eumeta japonica]
MQSFMDISEASRQICKVHATWKSIVSAYPAEKQMIERRRNRPSVNKKLDRILFEQTFTKVSISESSARRANVDRFWVRLSPEKLRTTTRIVYLAEPLAHNREIRFRLPVRAVQIIL